MIDKLIFARGLTGIADQLSQSVPKSKNDAYYAALGDEVSVEEWVFLTEKGVKRFGWGPFMPTVPDLLDALQRLRGEPSRAELDRQLATEAGEAYEAVMGAGTYTAEAGTVWSHRGVAEKCGRAAAEAFTAAGGPTAWATTWDEARRRERFLAAYQQAVREQPSMSMRALPPSKADEAKQLPAGAEADPQLTQGEAKGFLEKLREIIPADIPKAPRADAFAVRCDPERYARIKAEAERLKLEDGAKAS